MQWSRWAMTFLLALAASGCLVDAAHNGQPADGVVRIACLGDSNTWPFEYFPNPPGPHDRWCEKLGALLTTPPLPTTHPANTPVETRNYGIGGGTVCNFWQPPLERGNGLFQAGQAFADQADMVIAAFGTNDFRLGHYTPEQIVECYQAIHDAAATHGTLMLVALTPPIYPEEDNAALNAQINDLNTQLRAHFYAFEILDFHDGFTSDLFLSDGLHLSDAGQDLRAARANVLVRYPD